MLVIGGAHSRSGQFVGTGTAVGTCGELVQGFTSDGQPFHVTCPIEKSSTVSVTVVPAKKFSVVQPGERFEKIELSLLRTAQYLDLEPCEIKVARWTDLEIGKGMGSSTADIVAAARALANSVDRSLNASELASIATSIESSDGSMHPGIVAFNQKTGALLRRYAWYPQFVVVMVIPKDSLNTESVNFTGKKKLGAEFDEILRDLDKASAERSAARFAECATRSGRINQGFVPNPHFALLEDRVESFGGIGLKAGHTGTVVGMLFDAAEPTTTHKAAAAVVEIHNMFPDARVGMTLTPVWVDPTASAATA